MGRPRLTDEERRKRGSAPYRDRSKAFYAAKAAAAEAAKNAPIESRDDPRLFMLHLFQARREAYLAGDTCREDELSAEIRRRSGLRASLKAAERAAGRRRYAADV